MRRLANDRTKNLREVLQSRQRLLNEEVRAKQERPFSELNDLDHVGDDADESVAITLADLRVLEADRDVTELRAIAAALKRLEEGTYGYCGDCGDEILTQRLAAQPTAARCVSCQQQYERLYSPGRGPKL
ncbi:MAG: TraR/DksA family transcriptional regulator [Burkholderiales bacterium]